MKRKALRSLAIFLAVFGISATTIQLAASPAFAYTVITYSAGCRNQSGDTGDDVQHLLYVNANKYSYRDTVINWVQTKGYVVGGATGVVRSTHTYGYSQNRNTGAHTWEYNNTYGWGPNNGGSIVINSGHMTASRLRGFNGVSMTYDDDFIWAFDHGCSININLD